jgi:hypothetical protein
MLKEKYVVDVLLCILDSNSFAEEQRSNIKVTTMLLLSYIVTQKPRAIQTYVFFFFF